MHWKLKRIVIIDRREDRSWELHRGSLGNGAAKKIGKKRKQGYN